jgi:Phage derived protein Gp49-like (DUF891)
MKLIEAARASDGREYAEEFLLALRQSAQRTSRSAGKDRSRLADVAVRFEDYAQSGSLKIPRELRRDLRPGLSEIKAGDVRLLFYELSLSDHGDVVRLTNGFVKRTERTPRKVLDRAAWVMKGDQL